MLLGRFRKRMFGISLEETTVARRGFAVSDDGVRQYLEEIGRTFVHGYHGALVDSNPESLADTLRKEIEIEYQGFAFEGAGMGLALLDLLTPWPSNRLQRFLDGSGNGHYYMIHIGLGWALARLRRRVEGHLKRLDPVVGWLAVEGYGFHEGYFAWTRYIENQEPPPHQLTGYARRVFDQGLGRSLWFVKGANVERITDTINTFASARQSDLWSGVGLACGYAGGVNSKNIKALKQASGAYYPELAQGVAFAAATRHRAKNPVAHTELACQIICGLSLDETAALTDTIRETLPISPSEIDKPEPAWELWQQRVQAKFVAKSEPLPQEPLLEALIK